MDSLKYYAAITAMCTLSFVPCHAEPVRAPGPEAQPARIAAPAQASPPDTNAPLH